MMEVRVCCTPELATGFRLAGVPVVEARDVDAARAAIAADVGVIWLVQDVLDVELPGTLVVPFPGPAWREVAAEDRVLEILRRAIGYRVRLR